MVRASDIGQSIGAGYDAMSGTISTIGTTTSFQPTSAGPFQFGATLDGTDYICEVRWNLWAQRWYLFVYTITRTLVLARALVASPASAGINMAYGLFLTSVMYFWDETQTFQVIP